MAAAALAACVSMLVARWVHPATTYHQCLRQSAHQQLPPKPTDDHPSLLPTPVLQHGRFHDLDKFEPHRRSCIAALSHHRQRRRTFGGKPVGRGQPGATKQGSDAEQPPQPPQQQGQRAAAMAVHTVPPNTPSQSLGCAPCDSEAATPATPVCFAGEKGSRWQGASFAPRLAAAPAEPARPALTVAAVAAASPGQPAAGGSAALQPAAGVQPAASGGDMRSAAVDAVAELELLFDEQPQLSSISHSEEMADVSSVWVVEFDWLWVVEFDWLVTGYVACEGGSESGMTC